VEPRRVALGFIPILSGIIDIVGGVFLYVFGAGVFSINGNVTYLAYSTYLKRWEDVWPNLDSTTLAMVFTGLSLSMILFGLLLLLVGAYSLRHREPIPEVKEQPEQAAVGAKKFISNLPAQIVEHKGAKLPVTEGILNVDDQGFALKNNVGMDILAVPIENIEYFGLDSGARTLRFDYVGDRAKSSEVDSTQFKLEKTSFALVRAKYKSVKQKCKDLGLDFDLKRLVEMSSES
jgi:hypothetical protein